MKMKGIEGEKVCFFTVAGMSIRPFLFLDLVGRVGGGRFTALFVFTTGRDMESPLSIDGSMLNYSSTSTKVLQAVR